jgi:hypothetical protein
MAECNIELSLPIYLPFEISGCEFIYRELYSRNTIS